MNNHTNDTNQHRRTLLKGAGAIGAGTLATMAMGGTALASAKAAMAKGMVHRKHATMTDSMNHCVLVANDCSVHCLDLIKQGDDTIIDCLRSVEQLRAFCQAHCYLSAADSPHLNDMCQLAIKVCGDCSKECDKHAKKHALCKACRDACDDCVKQCKRHLKAAASA